MTPPDRGEPCQKPPCPRPPDPPPEAAALDSRVTISCFLRVWPPVCNSQYHGSVSPVSEPYVNGSIGCTCWSVPGFGLRIDHFYLDAFDVHKILEIVEGRPSELASNAWLLMERFIREFKDCPRANVAHSWQWPSLNSHSPGLAAGDWERLIHRL